MPNPASGWPRCRLALGGKLPGYEDRLGPPVAVSAERAGTQSGKGGALKRLVAPLDPRHVRVAQYGVPTPDEKRHHFLWRFFPALPGWGGMTVFDRSWYGRVLVERVEGLATVDQWGRAYGEIVDFERSLGLEGTIMIKFWIHVSAEEQLKRFKERESNPLKQWKLTESTGVIASVAATICARSRTWLRRPTTSCRGGSSWRVTPSTMRA